MQKKSAAEQQNQDFQFILSKFSHELRNPIALINSELQMMVSDHPEITSYKYWDDIMDNLEYVKELLKELSDYNNAGKPCRVSTDTSVFLRTVAESFRPTLEYLGISLETDIPSSLPVLSLDCVKIRQALLNLLRNAQESISHPGGKILVRAECLSHGICISIRDNGCGMDSGQLQDIFEPFVTYKPGGTGLGLAVTRQIIEAHQGRLEAESCPNQGSAFRIFLG